MKKLILLVLLLLSSISLAAQTQQGETKGSFIKDGKLYWNKSLAVTITLSSPGVEGIDLKEPFYLDTEGINYIRTKWLMDSTGHYVSPLQEQIWKVYADGTSPKTTVKLISSEKYKFRGKTYYSDDLRAELISTDALSGVQKIYYSINDSAFVLYDSLIAFDPGYDISLKFYAVDNVGNIEAINEIGYDYDNNNLSFGVDNSPPITFVLKDANILSPRNVIELISQDAGVGVNAIYYYFDSTKVIPYVEPIKLIGMDDGAYKLSYFAVDWINNKEEVRSTDFYLDAIPPEITIEEKIIKDELTNLRHITILTTDNKSGVDKIWVQLDSSGEFLEYTKPFYVDISKQKLTIKAIDQVGNVSVRTIKYSK